MRTTKSYAQTDTLHLLRAFTEAWQELTRREERQLDEWGMAASEFDVVATLGNTEGMKMCELAQRSLNTKSNITRVVKELERRGWVERRRNPDCEREVIVKLTPQGEDVFVETYPQAYQFLKGFFDARLTTDQQRNLIALLQKLSGKEPTG